jgi:hypothetical protein
MKSQKIPSNQKFHPTATPKVVNTKSTASFTPRTQGFETPPSNLWERPIGSIGNSSAKTSGIKSAVPFGTTTNNANIMKSAQTTKANISVSSIKGSVKSRGNWKTIGNQRKPLGPRL